LKLANILYREARGHRRPDGTPYASFRNGDQIECKHAPRTGSACRRYSGQDAEGNATYTNAAGFTSVPSEGAFGRVPAIFVKVADAGGNGFLADYRWVRAVNETTPTPIAGDVVLGTVDEFLTAAGHHTDWPAFAQRLAEMNHKNAGGSRSGDVVTVLDGQAGYLTVNNTAEIYPGWHGGPTRSESLVPLFFAMPGRNFVDESGEHIAHPEEFALGYNEGLADPAVSQTLGDDGFTRNWQLAHILKHIVTKFRDD
jgi:hypothetical protein